MNYSLDGDEAIAIIGISCKLPGANNLEEYWEVLRNGRNTIRPIPADRFDINAFYDANPDAPGKTYIKQAGFIDNPYAFDNLLFGISDVEAAKMDPQQKWTLECVYRALENAGIPMEKVSGSKTGVYMGAMSGEYNNIVNDDLNEIDGYNVTAGERSLVSAKTSYIFNLLGPSMTISTGCSSAMTCIHIASQAIRNGECSLAICGGINAMFSASMFVALSKARMASQTGQSQTFTDLADGYVRAEGCAIVILKKLGQAIADNDNIWATIGTGTNQDGQTATPINAPSGSQQAALLQKVHSMYGVNPEDITFFEAHGTGTPKGDPVETKAIGEIIGSAKQQKGLEPLKIGAVKTNIGHTEATAGVASLIKVLLMMKYKEIAPSVIFGPPNRSIDFDKLHLEVVKKTENWSGEHLIAGINSFGYGGSNAYAAVKQWHQTQIPGDHTGRQTEIIVLSALQKDQLQKTVENTVTDLDYVQDMPLYQLSYTTTTRRSHSRNRIATVTGSVKEAQEKLKKVSMMQITKKEKLHTIFICNGMGTAWKGMCKELLNVEPVFRETIREIDAYLREYVSWSLEGIFTESFDSIDSSVVQPATFACQVALARLWKHWGIEPDIVIGFSLGEVAAGHIAGYITLEQAVRVIYYRGKLLEQAVGGKMLVVGNFPVTKLEQMILKYKDKVTVAAYNSPTSCTLAGDTDVIHKIQKILKEDEKDVFVRLLGVTTAFHSHHCESILTELKQSLSWLRKESEPCYKLITSVSGTWASRNDYITAEFWCKNVRRSVLFDKAFTLAVDTKKTNIVFEIGPRPALRSNIHELFQNGPYHHLASMHKNSEMHCIQSSLCEAFKIGLSVNWNNYHQCTATSPAAYPRLVMEQNQFHFEPESWTRRKKGIMGNSKTHMFVSPSTGLQFTINISEDTTPFVFDHQVRNQRVPPGAFYAEIAVACIMMIPHLNCLLKNICTSVFFRKKLEVFKDEKFRLLANITEKENKYEIDIKAGDNTYAVGYAHISDMKADISPVHIDEIKGRCLNHVSGTELYEKLKGAQFKYGSSLRVVQNCFANSTECLSFLKMQSAILQEYRRTYIHASVLDGMAQSIAAFNFLFEGPSSQEIPVSLEGMRIYGPMEVKMVVHLVIQEINATEKIFSATICNHQGTVLVTVSKYQIAFMSTESNKRQVTFQEIWEDDTNNFISTQLPRPSDSKYLIIANDVKKANSLKQQIHSVAKSEPQVEVFSESGVSVRKQVETFRETQCKIGAVIYLQTQVMHRSEISETIEQMIYKRCETIVEILKELQNVNNVSIPLYVVTIRAKNIIDIPDEAINLPDFAIWGFVRSAAMEASVATALVDIENSETDTMKDLANFVHRYMPSKPEWCLHNQQFLCSYVIQSQRMDDSHRKHKMDNSANISLQSSRADILCNLKHFYQVKEPTEKDGIRVKLDSGVFPVRLNYAATTTVLENGINTMDEFSSHGHPVLILNSKGHIKGSTKVSQKAILYPQPYQSIVSIPEECMTDSESLPRGAEYVLPQLLIIQEICRKLDSKKYSQAFLLKQDNQDSDIADIAHNILSVQYKKNFVADISHYKINKERNNLKLVALLLFCTPSGPNDISLLEARSTTIIAVEELVGAQTISQLRHKGFTVDTIQMNHMFSPAVLRILAPLLFRWLKQFSNFPRLKVRPSCVSLTNIQNLSRNSNKDETPQDNCVSIPETLSVTKESMFRRNAKYLLIGGLQGLGWDLGEYMARHNAGILVCVSRSPPTKQKLHEILKLEQETGVEIIWAQCDISNFEKTQVMLKQVRLYRDDMPIKGIFHSAVVYSDKVFQNMTKDVFLKVTGPKILGSWNLHLLTVNDNLDYFVLHSSTASLLGNAGQTNYAAANGFLDGLSVYRRQIGLAGQTINWGPLQAGILERESKTEETLRSQGWELLRKEEIKMCFENALMSNRVNSIFFKSDNVTLAETLDVSGTENEGFVLKDRLKGPRLGERLKYHLRPFISNTPNLHDVAIADPKERTEAVKTIVASVVGILESDIDKNTPLVEIGIHSMHAIILRNKINKILKTHVSVEEILKSNATVGSLANLGLANLGSTSTSRLEMDQHTQMEVTQVLNSERRMSSVMPTTSLSTSYGANPSPNPTSGADTNTVLQETFRKKASTSSRKLGHLLQVKIEPRMILLEWQRKDKHITIRLKDVEVSQKLNGNGTRALLIKSSHRLYKFNHTDGDTVDHWVIKLKEYKLMDIFMNDRMLWAEESPAVPQRQHMQPQKVQTNVKQSLRPTTEIFGKKAWKSQESVFSYTSTNTTYL